MIYINNIYLSRLSFNHNKCDVINEKCVCVCVWGGGGGIRKLYNWFFDFAQCMSLLVLYVTHSNLLTDILHVLNQFTIIAKYWRWILSPKFGWTHHCRSNHCLQKWDLSYDICLTIQIHAVQASHHYSYRISSCSCNSITAGVDVALII